jgi:SAM-dependent methyltransferase
MRSCSRRDTNDDRYNRYPAHLYGKNILHRRAGLPDGHPRAFVFPRCGLEKNTGCRAPGPEQRHDTRHRLRQRRYRAGLRSAFSRQYRRLRGRLPCHARTVPCGETAKLAPDASGHASIDICTGGYALRNAPDLAATVAEIARVVRPGGVAAFLDFSRDPRAPVFLVHLMLLRIWGGLWGLLLHGNPRIYGYIAESLARFPDRKLLRALFAAHGFSEKNSCLRMFGMIEIVVFEKGQRP